MRKIMSFAIILILIMLNVSCNQSDSYITKQVGTNQNIKNFDNELRYALWSAPSGIFAPQYEMSDYDNTVISLAYEPLVMINPQNEYEGILATDWEISEDQKTILFHLRNNVKWHDGEDFTVEDVLFTLEYISNPDYSGSKFYAISAIKGVDDYHLGLAKEISGIEIIDNLTIKITTKDIYAPMLEHIGEIRIFPQHIWKDVDIKNAYENIELMSTTNGTGPYMFDDKVSNQEISMIRNSEYWGGEPSIERITFKIMNSEIAQVKMINGDLDIMPVSTMNPNDLQLYVDAGITINEVSYNSFQSIILNTEHEILSNVYVRKAIAMAIDRKSMVDTLIFGHGNIANTVYKKDHWAYPSESNIEQYEYDEDRAVRYLVEKAGLSFKDGVMSYKGKPIVLSLIYPSGNKARELSAPIIQENLSNIGIEVILKKVEFSDLINTLRYGEFDMSLVGNGFDIDPDVSRLFISDLINSSNYSRYSNPRLDELLDKGVKVLDRDKRKKIYGEVAELLNDELPVIFLYNWIEGRVISNRLKGVECYPYNYFYNVHEWYFDE